MQNTKTRLAERLHDAIAMTPNRLYMAGGKGNVLGLSSPECLPWPRINIKIEGNSIISMYESGQERQHEIREGDIYFISAFAPVKLHEVTGSGLSLVLCQNYLRIVYGKWNDLKILEREYYHIYDSLRMATVYAFKSLDALCETEIMPSPDIAGRLIHLVMKMAEEDLSRSHNETSTRSQNLWQQLVDYVEDHCLGDLSREKLSDIFKITPEYVSKLFQRYGNSTYKEYIIRRRMEHAAQMLLSGKYSVDEAAWQCGFKHTAYFIKTFRLYHGMTPGSFRTLTAAGQHENRNISSTGQTRQKRAYGLEQKKL
ncbi:MAG: AraC family transcriptional regulator [Lentisphaerota bacterium]